MDRRSDWRTRLRVVLMVTLATAYAIPGASCVDSLTGVAGSVARNFNPCGTILVCDPLEWEYAVGNLDPFNPDFEECPLSADPSQCLGGAWPPTGGGGAAADPAGAVGG